MRTVGEASVDYKKAVDRLLSLTDLERVSGQATHVRRYDLTRMEAFLGRLGNPQLDIPTVHITGTKGKGSVAAMVASILTAAGLRPGRSLFARRFRQSG